MNKAISVCQNLTITCFTLVMHSAEASKARAELWVGRRGPRHPFLDFLDPPVQTVQCSYVIQLFSVLN